MTSNKRNESITSMMYDDFPSLVAQMSQTERLDKYPREEWSTIPLLEDILRVTPSEIAMIIEFKQDSEELISEVLRLVTESGRLQSTFWFSLSESVNKKLRVADKRIPTICSVLGMLKILALHYLCLLPFCQIEDAVFGITVEEVNNLYIRINSSSIGYKNDLTIISLDNLREGAKGISYFLFAGSHKSIIG